MKRVPIQLSAALALIAGSGLSSCGIVRSYTVYYDQMAPIREDSVAVEEGEGLPQLGDTESLAEAMRQDADASLVSMSQNQPNLPEQEPGNAGASQNQPELADRKPEPAVASQNQPELTDKPKPEPAATGMRQNQPDLSAKPVPKPDKPALTTKQNQPELAAKPKPEPKKPAKTTKPEVSTKQNQPELAAKPKPEPKKPAKTTKPEVNTKQNQPELAAKPKPESKKPAKAKPEPKPEAKAKPAKDRRLVVVTLKKGDSLELIAREHGVTLAALCKENGITANTRLRSGTQIRIPRRSFWRRVFRFPWGSGSRSKAETAASTTPPAAKSKPAKRKSTARKRKMQTYTVKPGDTISEIAKKYDISSSSIIRANDLSSRDVRRLREGQKLSIPTAR